MHLTGAAGSDIVTLHVLGEIISGPSVSLCSAQIISNLREGETNHVSFIPLHGEVCEPRYDNLLYFSSRNFHQTQCRVNQLIDKTVTASL